MVYFMFDQTLNVVSDIALFLLQLELPVGIRIIGKVLQAKKVFRF